MNNDKELLKRAADALRSELGPVPPYYIYGLIQEMEEAYLYPEPESDKPVVVIDDNFGSKQSFKDIAPHSHVIDIHVRYCGAWYVFEGDWIKQALPRIEFNQIDNRGIKFTLESHKIKDYTRPEPERKPMTEGEIAKGFLPEPTTGMKRFRAGVRFAEQHHGIGGES